MTAETTVQVDVGAALDTEVEVVPVVDIPADELLAEFARVMHEWGFVPFQRGEVRFPTLAEAREAVAKTPYIRS